MSSFDFMEKRKSRKSRWENAKDEYNLRNDKTSDDNNSQLDGDENVQINTFIFSRLGFMLCTDLREDKSFSLDLNFFHDFG